MDAVTTRELKNQTSAILRRVRRGEMLEVTRRGEIVAVLVPPDSAPQLRAPAVRPEATAWSDIRASLAASEPQYDSWQEAIDSSRGRR